MADGGNPVEGGLEPAATKLDLVALIDLAAKGTPIDGVEVFDTDGLSQFLLPNDKTLARPLMIDNDVVLVQPDGTIVVLLDGGNGAFVIHSGDLLVPASELTEIATPEANWSLLSDAKTVDLRPYLGQANGRPGSSVEPDESPVNISSDRRERNKISPIQINSGRAVSVQLEEPVQMRVSMASPAGRVVNNSKPKYATPNSARPTHTPVPSSKNRTKRNIPIRANSSMIYSICASSASS